MGERLGASAAAGADAARARVIAASFDSIWALCVRHATSEELAAHEPRVHDLTSEQLASRVLSWPPEVRAAFSRSLSATRAREAAGDRARGRRRLARKLERVAGQVADWHEKARSSG